MRIACYPTFEEVRKATELGLELGRQGQRSTLYYVQPGLSTYINANVHYHEVNVPEYPLFHYQPYELALSSKLVDMVKLYKLRDLHVH
jgi:hypothetical protein